MGGATDDNAIKGKTTTGLWEIVYVSSVCGGLKCDILSWSSLQRKYKTVQKLEGATTQKSLDEEVKSTENVPVESTSQKPKSADEDSAQTKHDAQASSNSTSVRKDSKQHGVEEAKEKPTYATGTSTNATQSEQGANVQEKDTVDSAETAAVTSQSREPENATPNDKANGM